MSNAADKGFIGKLGILTVCTFYLILILIFDSFTFQLVIILELGSGDPIYV